MCNRVTTSAAADTADFRTWSAVSNTVSVWSLALAQKRVVRSLSLSCCSEMAVRRLARVVAKSVSCVASAHGQRPRASSSSSGWWSRIASTPPPAARLVLPFAGVIGARCAARLQPAPVRVHSASSACVTSVLPPQLSAQAFDLSATQASASSLTSVLWRSWARVTRGRLPAIGRPRAPRSSTTAPRPPRTRAGKRRWVGRTRAWPRVHPGILGGVRAAAGL